MPRQSMPAPLPVLATGTSAYAGATGSAGLSSGGVSEQADSSVPATKVLLHAELESLMIMTYHYRLSAPV
jgi:hypothetical protein